MSLQFVLRGSKLLIATLPLFLSCKKSASSGEKAKDSGYYMRFKVDGRLLSDTAVARIGGSNFIHIVNVAGARNVLSFTSYMDSTSMGRDNLFISILSSGPFPLRTYKDSVAYADEQGFTQSELQMEFVDEKGDQYAAARLRITATALYPETRVTILKIDSSEVKGTFSGTLSHGPYPGGGVDHVITEGEFFVPLLPF